jgi:hypothetical protein
MSGHFRSAFFAFPSEPAELYDTISAAVSAPDGAWDKIAVKPWPHVNIFGSALADQVRNEISYADLLVCDITFPNCNVYYEIGYALGLSKPIAPVLNTSLQTSAVRCFPMEYLTVSGTNRMKIAVSW